MHLPISEVASPFSFSRNCAPQVCNRLTELGSPFSTKDPSPTLPLPPTPTLIFFLVLLTCQLSSETPKKRTLTCSSLAVKKKKEKKRKASSTLRTSRFRGSRIVGEKDKPCIPIVTMERNEGKKRGRGASSGGCLGPAGCPGLCSRYGVHVRTYTRRRVQVPPSLRFPPRFSKTLLESRISGAIVCPLATWSEHNKRTRKGKLHHGFDASLFRNIGPHGTWTSDSLHLSGRLASSR